MATTLELISEHRQLLSTRELDFPISIEELERLAALSLLVTNLGSGEVDQREYDRIPLETLLRLRPMSSDWEVIGRVLDVSAGGIRAAFEHDYKFEIGDSMTVAVLDPERVGECFFAGTVAWVRGNQVGIEFSGATKRRRDTAAPQALIWPEGTR